MINVDSLGVGKNVLFSKGADGYLMDEAKQTAKELGLPLVKRYSQNHSSDHNYFGV